MSSIDDVLAGASRRTETLHLLFDEDLERRHDDAQRALLSAKDPKPSDLLRLAEAVTAVEDEIRARRVAFVVQGMGRHAWSDLIAAHPPTDEQRLAGGRRVPYNPETFPYAALAASIVAPEGMTVEKARQLEEVLTEQEWDGLMAAVLKVNVGVRDPGESEAASVVLRRLRPSSEHRSDSVSDAASSSDAA